MMSEAKFTKGEWCAYIRKGSINGYIDIESSEGELVCSFDFCERAEQRKVSDAHLIAAAPEMYKMLERVIHAQQYADNEIEHSDLLHDLYDEITKLLAKARGEK